MDGTFYDELDYWLVLEIEMAPKNDIKKGSEPVFNNEFAHFILRLEPLV